MLHIESRHPDFTTIIDTSSDLQQLATGFDFTEGPVWHAEYGSILFSDIMGNSLYSWHPDHGITQRRRNSYMANGNAYDRAGRLLTCEHATSRLSCTDLSTGTYEVLATHYDGTQLNSPNDVIVHSNGDIYFTDPLSGRSDGYGVPREPDLPFRGVYRFRPSSQELTLLVDDFNLPNGLCLSRDETQLFVNDTREQHIRIFDITEDGVTNGRLWANTVGDLEGVPDGMKIDSRDNIYTTGPGGIQVFNSAAECLGVIIMPEKTANFCFGDADLCSLYITASTSLYRLRVYIPGHPLFPNR